MSSFALFYLSIGSDEKIPKTLALPPSSAEYVQSIILRPQV